MSIFNKEDIDDAIKECVVDLESLGVDMRAVTEMLREHVADEHGLPVCGAVDFEVDLLVTAALASDCDACRVKIGVALVGDKGWNGQTIGVHPEPEYTPEPMKNADEICASARRNRDGS